jgi:catechol 2,3-dioxygenase-like lactoylglutathione lyase family enzyme
MDASALGVHPVVWFLQTDGPEVAMSSTQMSSEPTTHTPTATTIDLKLEVVVLPVSDVDRAKRFYEGLGWRLDGDFVNNDWRGVQLTPPGSSCSIHFGKGLTSAAPGSAQGLYLVVDDLEAARADLIRKGVAVTEPFHFASIGGPRLAGLDPQRRTYSSYASFSDPDGNSWLLQEITTRLPGRGLSRDVATLIELLKETEERHGEYEPKAPKHHWSEWYAAYVVARERGRTSDEAAGDAALRVESRRDLARA